MLGLGQGIGIDPFHSSNLWSLGLETKVGFDIWIADP